MLDLAQPLARLRAKCSNWKDVNFAVDAKEAFEDIKRYPSMYLLQSKVTGGTANVATQVHMQQITEQFEVYSFLAARGVGVSSSKRSEQLIDYVKARTDELEDALIGWTWDPLISPLVFVSADVVELTPERLVLRHILRTEFQYRKTTIN